MATMNEAARNPRQFSLCLVIQTIVHCGPVSRTSIARQTGLSKQTVSEIAASLERDGWIRQTGRTSGHVGRSAITYEIVPGAACIAAVDLGGTRVRAAIADLSCEVLASVAETTDKRGGMWIVRQIARLCRTAARESGIGFERVRLAVVGVPGVPDRDTGRIDMAPNLPGFGDSDVRSSLQSAIGVDVLFENDVNLAVTGEHWAGAGMGVDDLVFIALGTGIGAGVMVAGELVRGAGGAAGEIGFLPIGADPFEAESRRAGALERVVGAAGTRARYRTLARQDLTVPQIFDRAAAGEANAQSVIEYTARTLARAIAAVVAIASPEQIVLGGSIGSRTGLVALVRDFAAECLPRPVGIVATALGSRAALVGGAAMGLGQLHAILFPGAGIALRPARIAGLRKVAP